MGHVSDVIKRGGKRHNEAFDVEKLHSSVRAALLSANSPEGLADQAAGRVTDYVTTWIKSKPIVTSNDLRRKATEALSTLHPEAAYLYKHYKTII